jgi:ribonucleotide reductase alpha subunit
MFKSNRNPQFRSKFSEDIFNTKYSHEGAETFHELSCTVVNDVCQSHLTADEKEELIDHISNLRFIPGGRYLYYAGREKKFFNNCYLLKAEEDNREDWAKLSWEAESCLMTGGGIGVDYSAYRQEGQILKGTGGISSGPIPKMQMINEIGRHVMQGGSRRSAIYASLNWKHPDIDQFLISKNWHNMPVGNTGQTIFDVKQDDFNFPAPLDMTNISLNYDTEWLLNYWETGEVGDVFKTNVQQALRTAEPGFSFNFFEKENETLRNACTEVTGIEPIFAVAYKRRYLKNKRWHYQYVVDSAAQEMIEIYNVKPDNIESALDLAKDYERRLNFQANVQEYVDMAISSTINLPEWGTENNNEDGVERFTQTLAKYAHRLRGFTCFPDGCRGGQPLTSVSYEEATEKLGEEFEDNIQVHDICDISGSAGICGA